MTVKGPDILRARCGAKGLICILSFDPHKNSSRRHFLPYSAVGEIEIREAKKLNLDPTAQERSRAEI